MIDCDVHNNWSSAEVLLPFLAPAFREYLERGELPGGRGSFPHAHRPWLHPEDCEGPVCGTVLPSDDFSYRYGREGEIVRCAWHGWEFDIGSGQALADPTVRARSYPVTVEDGALVMTLWRAPR